MIDYWMPPEMIGRKLVWYEPPRQPIERVGGRAYKGKTDPIYASDGRKFQNGKEAADFFGTYPKHIYAIARKLGRVCGRRCHRPREFDPVIQLSFRPFDGVNYEQHGSNPGTARGDGSVQPVRMGDDRDDSTGEAPATGVLQTEQGGREPRDAERRPGASEDGDDDGPRGTDQSCLGSSDAAG